MAKSVQRASALELGISRGESGQSRPMPGAAAKETVLNYEFFPAQGGQTSLATIRYPGGDLAHEYDRLGRISMLSNGAGEVRYEWDQFGRRISVARDIGPRVEFRYNTLGRLKGYSVGQVFDVGYEYDFLGSIAAIKTPVGIIRYEFLEGQGKIIRTLPNRMRTIWDHAPGGQLATITHVDYRDCVIAKFTYTYRPDKLIRQVQETSPRGEKSLDFEYDGVRRLVAVSDSRGPTWRCEYDARGNRTKEISNDGPVTQYMYDWAGRLTDVNGKACAHDASGNLTLARFGDELRRYAFDDGNRISAARGAVRYEHDEEGCLVARVCRGQRTVYIPDLSSEEWRPLAELSPNGRRRFYVYGECGLIMIVEGGAARFFLHDHTASTRCVADSSGNIVVWRDFSAFGVVESGSADPGLTSGFAGLFWDPAASLYLTRHRAYSPELGRFLQIDPLHRAPLGSRTELSTYVYRGNDPVNHICYR